MTEFANFLDDKGHEVHVLTIKRCNSYSVAPVNKNINVTELRCGSFYWQQHPNSSTLPAKIMHILSRATERFLRKSLTIDAFHHHIDRFERYACNLIAENGISNVVISSPPHSLQLLVPRLGNRFGDRIKLICDYRDPWTSAARYRPSNDEMLEFCERAEAMSIMEADIVSTVSTGLVEDIYKKTGRRVDLIQNGFSRASSNDQRPCNEAAINFIANAHQSGRIVLIYAGSGFYGPIVNRGKNLAPVIDAIAASDQFSSTFSLIIQGAIKWQKNLPSNLDALVLPPASNSEVLATLSLADIGLSIDTEPFGAHLNLDGKLNDYVAAYLPIWIVASSSASSKREFIDYNESRPFFSDQGCDGEIEETLYRIQNEWKSNELSNRVISEPKRSKYSREYQFNLLLSRLNARHGNSRKTN